ncbi:MAG: TonB-dependent receptor [Bacteroidetes bacterium]|nr:TonB-dependent receptor [Bacteroidota bacterium]
MNYQQVKMKASVKSRYFGLMPLLVIALTLCFALPAEAKNFDAHFPEELLSVRLKKISKKSGTTILSDQQTIGNARVSALNATNLSVEQALERSLSGTPFTWKKTAETSYAVLKKQANQQPQATQGKGFVSGRITDENGEPIPGVSVSIPGTKKGTITDVSGKYTLQTQASETTIEVSFLSYQKKKVTGIDIKPDKTTKLDITLSETSEQLSEVTVTAQAQRSSVAGMLLKQKTDISMTDGISAEQIARTPDKNIGETLKRVTGVSVQDNKYVVIRGLGERYNSAMMNGQIMPSTELNRKAFSFDIIPSNMVDAVTVAKTLTPDKSAEFGGGLVQVQTKDIPDKNFITMTYGLSVNSNTTGKNFLSMPMESRNYFALPSNNRNLFGKLNWKSSDAVLSNTVLNQVSGNYDVKNPAILSNNWGLSIFKPSPTPNVTFSIGRAYDLKNNQRIGVIASVSYRNTFQTQQIESTRFGFEDVKNPLLGNRYGFTANLSGLVGIGYNNKRLKLGLQTIYLRTLEQQLLIGTGNKDGYKQLAYFDQTTASNLSQNQLKGEYAIGNRGIKINWLGSYIRLDRLKPDNHSLTAAYLSDSTYGLGEFYISQPQSDLARGALRSWSRALENDLAWSTDVLVPFQFNIGKLDWSNSLKVGYAGWQKDRLFYVLNSGSSANVAYYPSLAEAFNPAEAGISIEFSRFSDDFHKKARLHAAYAMLDNKIASKLRLVWGLRAEYYNLNGLNQNLDKIKASVSQYDFSALDKLEPNWNIFPSVNLTYSLTSKMNLRLAYTKSIIRPDLRELSFFQEYDYELGGVYNSQTPIRSTKIGHWDFRYEWYPSSGELISFSLFHKQFDYPMEIYKDQNNRMFTLKNNKAATNKGLEIELRKSFAFTGIPILKQLTLYGNFTVLSSTVTPLTLNIGANDPNQPNKVIVTENVGEPEKRVQTGASNLTYNAGFYYDTKPIRVSMSYNYLSNRLIRPTVDYSQSLFEQPEKTLDAQVTVFMLKKKLEIKGTIGNLLNSYSVVYQNAYEGGSLSTKNPSTQQLRYQPGVDQINYKSKSGRTYSLNFTYNF